MSLVMFYSGILPKYLECTFKQIRLFNPNLDIHFLTDRGNVCDEIFKKYDVNPWNKDSFKTDKVREFETFYGRTPGDFWSITATRLIYIENFMRQLQFSDVYHFECDILLYYDLSELHDLFLQNFKNMAITVGGVDKCMTGMMFIRNASALEKMTHWWINTLAYYGINGIKRKYGMDMVHEMSLMKAYMDNTKGNLEPLPSLPPTDFNGTLFDAASWGQFVGGTTEGIPGAKPKDLYVSQMLIANPDWTVEWQIDGKGRKIPFFQEYRLNNLHIHSKKLDKYMS